MIFSGIRRGSPALARLVNPRYLPVAVTIGLFLLAYIVAGARYTGIATVQVLCNLLIDNAFIIVSAVGMTFVILSGGIDLSVAAVIAFTSMLSAALLERASLSPAIVIPIVLMVGTTLGAGMGALIQYFKIPPFVATLAGMFLARGACFLISIEAIPITNPWYASVAQFQVPVPGGFVSPNVVVALVVLAVGMVILHYTSFGRTVYAIGGNEQSALLMGLPVARTKVLIYALNGFCSALAGVVYTLYVLSGYGLYANGYELDIISAVVIGGTPLIGGSGFLLGTFFGVLIQGLIQVVITFDGTLNSWWTRIVVGMLTLFFIVMQRWLHAQGQKVE
ncbi:sugar ABC transporter permease YjfF [Chloroflexia bacterium SDU3-3]|nr:sugar ABC transporter permease YjfF [Chloroflexia bacterium SDU3-3]